MKKFNLEQLVFFAVTLLAVLVLLYKSIGSDLITGLQKNVKYQSSVDSIATLEGALSRMQSGGSASTRDLFNFKSARRVVAVQQPVQTATGPVKPVVKKNYTYQKAIEPVAGLELLIAGEGTARISVEGNARQIKVGDQVACANAVEVEYDAETGEKTGKTKPAGVINAVVVSIDKRNIYFSVPGTQQAIKLNSREGAKTIDADMVPRTGKTGTESTGDTEGGTTPKIRRQR